MSETEVHTGKLVELKKLRDKSLKEAEPIIKYIDEKADIDLEDDSLHSYVVFRYKNKYYELTEHKEYEYGEFILDYNINQDKSINMFTSFYNGGTCLSESVEDILEELDKELDEE